MLLTSSCRPPILDSQSMSTPAVANRDAGLRAWRRLFEGATAIVDLEPRQRALCVGVVQRIRLVPGESVEATLEDGTGRLRVIWTGRQLLPGVELGRGVRVYGTVYLEGDEPVMRNPTWCLVADPYSCDELRFRRSEGPAGGRTAPAAGRSSSGQLSSRRLPDQNRA